MNSSATSIDSRQRIVDAAQNLFHRNAYQAVGINAICAEAGVVKGSFYHFFPSKQALLAVVLEEISAQRQQTLQQTQTVASSGRERLLAFFSRWLDASAEQKASQGTVLGCALGVLASELSCSDVETRKLIQSNLADWQAQLRDLIQQGINDGSLSPSVEPVQTANALLAMLQGLSTLGRVSNQPELLRETAKLAIKRLLPLAYS